MVESQLHKARKFAEHSGVPVHEVPSIAMPPEEPEPSGEHMVHRLKLRPTTPELRERMGAIDITTFLPPRQERLQLDFLYHGGKVSSELSRAETERLMPFAFRPPGGRWHRAPVFHADPADPFIKKAIAEGRLTVTEGPEGRNADLAIPDEIFQSVSDGLFYRYIGNRVQWLVATNSSMDREGFEAKEFATRRWAEGNKRHERIIHEVILQATESIRASGGRALLSWAKMNSSEKALVESVMDALMPKIPADYRKEIVRRVGVSLMRNLSPDSQNPAESARRAVNFLNTAPHMKELQARGGIAPFRQNELLDIVAKAAAIKAARKRGPEE